MNQEQFATILQKEIRPFVSDLIHNKQRAINKNAYVLEAWEKLEEKLLSYNFPIDTFNDLNIRYKTKIKEQYI